MKSSNKITETTIPTTAFDSHQCRDLEVHINLVTGDTDMILRVDMQISIQTKLIPLITFMKSMLSLYLE